MEGESKASEALVARCRRSLRANRTMVLGILGMLVLGWWLTPLADGLSTTIHLGLAPPDRDADARVYQFTWTCLSLLGTALVGAGLLFASRRDAELSQALWPRGAGRRSPMLCAILGSVCSSALAHLLVDRSATPIAPESFAPTGLEIATIACSAGLAVVIVPITEELVFRGFLLAGCLRTMRRPPAVFLASAAFVIAHRRVDGSLPLVVLSAWLMCCFFAGGLLLAIVAHGCWNAVARALYWRSHLPAELRWLDVRDDAFFVLRLVLLLAGLAIALVGMTRLVRGRRTGPTGDAAAA